MMTFYPSHRHERHSSSYSGEPFRWRDWLPGAPRVGKCALGILPRLFATHRPRFPNRSTTTNQRTVYCRHVTYIYRVCNCSSLLGFVGETSTSDPRCLGGPARTDVAPSLGLGKNSLSGSKSSPSRSDCWVLWIIQNTMTCEPPWVVGGRFWLLSTSASGDHLI